MKRIYVLLACLCLLAASAAGSTTGIEWGRGPEGNTRFWNWPNGIGIQWKNAVERLLSSANDVGTGNSYYVDSGVTTEGDGSNWDHAVNTIAEAVALCTASNGDYIYVAEGHVENLSSATIFKISVIGVTVIGMGEGSLRPTFTTTATAGVAHLNATNVRVYNCRFVCGIDNTTTLAKIQGDDSGFIGCYFGEGGGDGDMNGVTAITVGVADGDSDRAVVIGNEINCKTDGKWVQGILLAKDMTDIRVTGNTIYGDFTSGACIEGQASSNAQVQLGIGGNILTQLDTGEPVIEIKDTSSTGWIVGNTIYSDTDGTTIDAGGLLIDGTNTWNVTGSTTDLGAAPAVPMIDSINNLIGYNDSDNLAVTSSVASNRDGSVLERLEFIAKYFETGTAGALVAPADTRSLYDVLGSDGTTTTGALAGSLLGAIGTNEAASATAFTSSSVESDRDGAILERLEFICKYLETGTPGALVAPASTFSVLDILGSDGSTTTGAVAGSLLGAIGTNETAANTPFTSATAESDRDGSVLERLEFLIKYFETGTPGALVAPASTFSILDILGSDGSTTTGAVAGSILGAIGTDEASAATAFASTNVQDDADGSVLERLEHVQSDTDKIDGATLGASPTAGSLTTFIANGSGAALGTALAAGKSLVDAIGTNGTSVADTATGVAGMIGVNDADNAMDTSTVVANGDGSVFERLEYGQTMSEKCISKTVSTIANGANNLFAVTGGPIKITEIVTYVTTTPIAAEGCLIGYNIDPTTPATDTAFGTDGTALECNNAAVGTALIWDGVLATDLTAATNGAAVLMGTDVSYGLLCPIGMIELTAAHDGAVTGELTVYMRYMPLSPASVVTAQ